MGLTAEQRREINISNSRASTGPRTAAGKLRAAQNALRHGLRAERFALPGEDSELLAALTDEWVDYYRPATPGLRALLDRAVLATVQHRRGALFQTAAVSKKMRAAEALYDQEQQERVARGVALFESDPEAAVRDLKRTAAGCRWLLEKWEL